MPMRGDFTTCMAMSGNGVSIGMEEIFLVRIRWVLRQVRTVVCEVVVIPIIKAMHHRRFAIKVVHRVKEVMAAFVSLGQYLDCDDEKE